MATSKGYDVIFRIRGFVEILEYCQWELQTVTNAVLDLPAQGGATSLGDKLEFAICYVECRSRKGECRTVGRRTVGRG
jgi:hypothetical protein